MGKSTSENPSEHIRRFFGDESHHASSGIIKNYSIGSWLGEIWWCFFVVFGLSLSLTSTAPKVNSFVRPQFIPLHKTSNDHTRFIFSRMSKIGRTSPLWWHVTCWRQGEGSLIDNYFNLWLIICTSIFLFVVFVVALSTYMHCYSCLFLYRY